MTTSRTRCSPTRRAGSPSVCCNWPAESASRDGDAFRVVHNLTQTEIAQLAGVSRETVSMSMADFARRGWIRVDGPSVLIRNPERLAQRGPLTVARRGLEEFNDARRYPAGLVQKQQMATAGNHMQLRVRHRGRHQTCVERRRYGIGAPMHDERAVRNPV
jgi:hypothetical protein